MTVTMMPLPDLRDVPDLGDGDLHIACECRPHLTFCGAYDESPMLDGVFDPADCCEECQRVMKLGCPNCGHGTDTEEI